MNAAMFVIDINDTVGHSIKFEKCLSLRRLIRLSQHNVNTGLLHVFKIIVLPSLRSDLMTIVCVCV